ncbi:lysin A [Gordonia phage Kampe]|uniref:Lysin A n=3 Tax=Gordonia phage Orchid TaxID=1838075 RepID=A0A160DH52_9CAUD|nr:endolysin [Gordonia phage Orchid]ANA87263.1 lysin A [Gordonia phage PatrickStar]ANA87376.1 lysin A [Gordonia phage Orchid]ANA87490.1 lysin A [Gordonia phage Kampe]
MAHLIDYSGGYPGAAAVEAAGFDGAIRYLCNSPDRGLTKKKITKAEADDYKAHGLQLVSNWQLGKGASADFKVGDPFRTGASMGQRALDEHFAVGGSGFTPIYFSVDEDVNLNTWNNRVLPWLNGIASIIGKEWVGVYGGQRSMWWAKEDGFTWLWQTLAWSRYDVNGNWNASLPVQWEDVHIRQYEVDKQKVNGIGIDRNTTHKTDYGQWGINRKPAPVVITEPQENAAVAKPNYTQLDMYGSGYSNRWGARISNILGHTQEAPDSATPENLARYCNGANGVSYHDIIGHGRLVRVVNPDWASWSVLDANPYTYNICFSGSRASMTRAEWLKRELDIRIFAWRAIEIARLKGVDTTVIKPPYKKRAGISDHNYVTRALGIGTHTDLGPNFPWDKLEQFVREYLSGAAPKPIVNAIDQEYGRAKAWIGNPVDPKERPTADGKGRFRKYEFGYIYWSPLTGAHAIPGRLFEVYARFGYETGFLGYPIGDHTVLHKDNDKSKEIVGGVQGFEHGAIYRQEGDDLGWPVGGDIRNMWNRSGFENGPYGWPAGKEIDIVPGVKIQDFTKARLLWAPNKVMALKPTDGHDEVLPVF